MTRRALFSSPCRFTGSKRQRKEIVGRLSRIPPITKDQLHCGHQLEFGEVATCQKRNEDSNTVVQPNTRLADGHTYVLPPPPKAGDRVVPSGKMVECICTIGLFALLFMFLNKRFCLKTVVLFSIFQIF
ncbi:Protein CBG21072 [Caenorhabditis briggsae]|uniref:Protein CBG21072 n=1 Tax=Caenorhabditis briggsae TaxID=6238 RepID=A8XZ95_CAEBR|nr:Protein CBG21072 [Caenorhabditis briggsae]CAP37962.1 Protein CBG21072 [Caenorhabditis briggsae]